MRIYLVRHGDAVSQEEAGSDRDRWLSPQGREDARILGRLLREHNVVPDAVVSSPLPRAVQTAELVAATLDHLGVLMSLRCLEPSAHPRVAANEVIGLGRAVVVVSHEPVLSALGAFLMNRPAFPHFRTAQCRAIEDGKPTFTARADVNRIEAYFVD